MSKVENKAAISAINSFFSSRAFTTYRTAGEGQAISATPLYHFYPSQTLRHSPGNYCGDLASAHIQQPDSNREPLVSERKSLTTKEAGAYNFTKSKNSSTGAFHIFKTAQIAQSITFVFKFKSSLILFAIGRKIHVFNRWDYKTKKILDDIKLDFKSKYGNTFKRYLIFFHFL